MLQKRKHSSQRDLILTTRGERWFVEMDEYSYVQNEGSGQLYNESRHTDCVVILPLNFQNESTVTIS